MVEFPIIVVHGGAGTVPDEYRELARKGVLKAIKKGWDILENGGSALDAVETAVSVMEDLPQFNAGTGSVLTELGTIEMDAHIMDGKTRNIGGVIAASRIKNPIKISRIIMEKSAHVLFAGVGVEKFALENGIKLVDPKTMVTERVRGRLKKFLEKEGSYDAHIDSNDPERREKFGTVGAVVIDKDGFFAAATSTGGVLGKKIGRVGDTPIVGAGNYADDGMAISATGVGEVIIRSVLGMEVKMQLKDEKDPIIASKKALEVMRETIGGQAGLIVVTRDGWAAVKTTKDLIYAARSSDMEDFHDFSLD